MTSETVYTSIKTRLCLSSTEIREQPRTKFIAEERVKGNKKDARTRYKQTVYTFSPDVMIMLLISPSANDRILQFSLF